MSYRPYIRHAFLGLAVGFVLSGIGFGSYTEVHRMFSLSGWRMFFSFAGALAVTGVGIALLRKPAGTWPERRIHRGTVPGAVLFGIGWATVGACPATILVQIGEGQAWALFTLPGILAGMWGFERVRRWRQWEVESC